MEIKFYEEVEDTLLKYAVIVSKFYGKWVFCKHRKRETYKIPGEHREKGESILQAAERELKEETGAIAFSIRPICVYSVKGKTIVDESEEESFGMLYYAEIEELEENLRNEIEKIAFFDGLPEQLTYPDIHPLLIA